MMDCEKGAYDHALEHINAAIQFTISKNAVIDMEYTILLNNQIMAVMDLERRKMHHEASVKEAQNPRRKSIRMLHIYYIVKVWR